jgi:predicted nucleotidyltransferase
MRLTEAEFKAVVEAGRQLFGPNLREIRLFGSRADLKKKGGDIDLLFLLHNPIENKYRTSRSVRRLICDTIGEQKIDVVIMIDQTTGNTEREQDFFNLIYPTSVAMCRHDY